MINIYINRFDEIKKSLCEFVSLACLAASRFSDKFKPDIFGRQQFLSKDAEYMYFSISQNLETIVSQISQLASDMLSISADAEAGFEIDCAEVSRSISFINNVSDTVGVATKLCDIISDYLKTIYPLIIGSDIVISVNVGLVRRETASLIARLQLTVERNIGNDR